MNKPTIRYIPHEEREQHGTQANRSKEKLPFRARFYYILAVVVSVIAAYAAFKATNVSVSSSINARNSVALSQQVKRLANKLAADEHSSCVIQQRGLPAGHALNRAMSDIHALLTFPPTAAQKRNEATVPPAQLRKELRVVKDLNSNLAAYSKAESKQPQTRKCQ